jgi:hypothetical protein
MVLVSGMVLSLLASRVMVSISKQWLFGFIPENSLNAHESFRQSMAGIAALPAIKFGWAVTDW